MSARFVVTALVVGLGCVGASAACTSGGGGTGPQLVLPNGKEEPGGSTNEPPGSSSGQEPSGAAGQEPGGSIDDPGGGSSSGGSSSSGSSGGGNDCLACATYDCTVTTLGPNSGGFNGTTTIVLTPTSDGCVDQQTSTVLLCGGGVTTSDGQDGGSGETWTGTGAGFTTTIGGVQFTCTQASAGSGSSPGGGITISEDAG
jgi:hypothetical protein